MKRKDSETTRRRRAWTSSGWKARRGYLRNVIDSVTSMMGRLEHLGAGDFEVMHEIDNGRPSEFEFLVMGMVEEEE